VIIKPLAPQHARAAFRCGNHEIDRYFHSQAGRDAARRLAAIFVLTSADDRPAGFYSLSQITILLPDLLGPQRQPESRYPALPAARLTRLAVDQRHQHQGLAQTLLADAISRVRQTHPSAIALIADSPNPGLYTRAGFTPFPDQPARWFKPMAAAGVLGL